MNAQSGLTFKQAAIKVLEEGSPLSCGDIADIALRKGYLKTAGKTPRRTMCSVIYADMKGKSPAFYRGNSNKFELVKQKKDDTTPDASDFSFKSAALKVLEEEGKPLSSQDISDIARNKGYLKTAGKTPELTMGARLYTDIKSNGTKSLFVQLGKNRFGLRSWNLEVIEKEILKEENREAKGALINRKRSIVGDPINFKGLIFGPLNENGVIFLFSKMHKDLGIFIEAIQPSYPDAKARRKTHRGWEDIWIEFEYKSSSFKVHGHDPKECDIIVCWEHDWKNCPLEVIELKKIVAPNIAS